MLAPWVLSGLLAAISFVLIIVLIRKRNETGNASGKLGSDLQLGAVPTLRRTHERMANELARVRRYQRPLSVVVLRLESDQLLLDLKRNLVSDSGNGSVEAYNQVMQTIQLVFSLVGSILKESLRESDVAAYDVPNNQYVIMLPESTRNQAALTVTRLKRLLFKRTAGHLVAGIAEFPTDGLIMGDLVALAIENCSHEAGGATKKSRAAFPKNGRGASKKKKIDETTQRK